MTYKVILMLGIVSFATAIEQGRYASDPSPKEDQPIYVHPTQRYAPNTFYKEEEYQHAAPVAYDFNYAVHDEQTGDIKSQKEVRNGDVVHGRYELIDSDGFRRIVEYTADSQNGFIAIVHREPVDIKIPQPIPQYNKLQYSAPVVKDIPIQGYPLQKVAFDLPKYSAAQFSPTAASIPRNVFSSKIQSVPAYRSPVHSVAFGSRINQNQDFQAPYLQPVDSTPVKENYGNQASPLSEREPQYYPENKYKTVTFSSNNLLHNTRANNDNGYFAPTTQSSQQRYFPLPSGNNFYPLPSDKSHHLPSNRAVHINYINPAKNYNSQDQNRFSLDYSGYNQVPTVQTKLVAPPLGPSAEEIREASRSQRLGVNQNDYTVPSHQEQTSTNSDPKPSQIETNESFGASTTPSYYH